MNSTNIIFAVGVVVLTFFTTVLGIHFVNAMDIRGISTKANSGVLKKSTETTSTNTIKADSSQKGENAKSKQQTSEKNDSSNTSQTTKKTISPSTNQPTYVSVPTASPQGKKLYNDISSKTHMPAEISGQPTAIWLGGWSGDVRKAANRAVSAASAQGALTTLVLYNIPNRDCGGYSAGGLGTSEAYREWVRSVALGIGNREAIVIVEPDALPAITCLSASDQANRYADIAEVVNILTSQTKAFIYLDAGNSSWVSASTMIERLEKANIAKARGFSLNVSNFRTTASSQAYGETISAKLKKSYVIDTSRNGQGPKGVEWCNPSGRGLGKKPTIITQGYLDAYLWIKMPGESDGECQNAPAAGVWWEAYAQELIRNAVY